jgi:hypothetical protein
MSTRRWRSSPSVGKSSLPMGLIGMASLRGVRRWLLWVEVCIYNCLYNPRVCIDNEVHIDGSMAGVEMTIGAVTSLVLFLASIQWNERDHFMRSMS